MVANPEPSGNGKVPDLLSRFPIIYKIDDPPIQLLLRRYTKAEKIHAWKLEESESKDQTQTDSDTADREWYDLVLGLLLEVQDHDGKSIPGGKEEIATAGFLWEHLRAIILEAFFRREINLTKAAAGSRGPGTRPESTERRDQGGGQEVQGLSDHLPSPDMA